MILALAGGVGGAKLVRGLASILEPGQLSVVVNTGDDFVFQGLSISPDLDTVTYTLAGLNNSELGWGISGETWKFLAALKRLGGEHWFQLGDQDLATHVMRSYWLSQGETLSQITNRVSSALGVRHAVGPMSDDPVRTFLDTDIGELDFQTYFVRERCKPKVGKVWYAGASEAKPSQLLSKAMAHKSLSAIIICPSNPILSVAPILALPGIRSWMENSLAPVIAVSPIIGGNAVKGPAAKLFRELGREPSVAGIAEYYGDLLDGLVIDHEDKEKVPTVSAFGHRSLVTNTLMKSDDDKHRLASDVLEFVGSLS
jgi:LPPG:FO 2-phospho-L-lactate transferase